MLAPAKKVRTAFRA
ncbi:hypothetical protein, partial [Nocardiopsis dassonvillei]